MAEPTAGQKFSKVAAEYCTFLEDHCAYSTKQFTAQCVSLLAAIDQAIPDLPRSDAAIAIKADVGPTNWIARNAAEKLGDQDSAVSDDLTAIYRFLKLGLLIYGTEPATAVAYWTSQFAMDCQPDLQRAQIALS